MRSYQFLVGFALGVHLLAIPSVLFADPNQQDGLPPVVTDDIKTILGISESGLASSTFEGEELDDFYSMRHKVSGNPEMAEGGQGQNPNQGGSFSKDINVPLNFKDSVSGFGDTMKSQAYADMHADLLNSPNAVQDITWQLTEPGIAAGFASASQRAALQLGTRFQAEESLLRQFEANPEWGSGLARAYFACINKVMTQTGGQNQDQSAWLRAQAQCAGDSYTPQQGGGQTGGTQSTFNDQAGTFHLFCDPDSSDENNQCGDASAADQETTILLSDRLFGKKPTGAAPPSTQAGDEGDPEKYREAFIDFIGDAKILMKNEEGGTANRRRKAIVVTRIRPEDPEFSKPNDFSTPKIHELEATTVFDTLRTALIGICQAKLQQGAFQNNGSQNEEMAFFEDQFQAQDPISYVRAIENECTNAAGPNPGPSGDPCASGGTAEDKICCKIRRINAPGFRWKILDFDFILSYLIPKLKEEENSCEKLFGEQMKFAPNNAGDPKDVRLSHILMKFMARKVAKARVLLAYMKMEEVVLKTSSGTLNDPIRRLALNMIYENAASKGDLKADYETNIMQLRQGLTVLPQVMARVTSQGGKNLGNAYSSYTNLMNSMGNNMRAN